MANKKVEIRLTEKQAALVEKMCESELHYKIHKVDAAMSTQVKLTRCS